MRPAALERCHDRRDARQAAGILPGGRLVQHHDRRPHGEDRGQRQQLALRHVEVVGILGRASVSPTCCQRLRDGCPHFASEPAQVPRPECDLGLHGPLEKLVVGVLEDVTDPAGKLRHGVLAVCSNRPPSPARRWAATGR